MDGLEAASQGKETGATSNAQWSIVFNNTDRTASIAFRRCWDDVLDVSVDGSVSRSDG